MHWQDIVISVGQWIMVIALFPSLFSEHKPAISSSVLTGVLIVAFGAAYASLHLWSSTISSSLLAIAWFMLAYQQWRKTR